MASYPLYAYKRINLNENVRGFIKVCMELLPQCIVIIHEERKQQQMLALNIIDEGYRSLHYMTGYRTLHYMTSFIDHINLIKKSSTKCQSQQHIQLISQVLNTQEKILSSQSHQWQIPTDRVALLRNLTLIKESFQNWRKGEATCQFCKKAIDSNRPIYEGQIQATKNNLNMNSESIEALPLKLKMKGIRTTLCDIEVQAAKCVRNMIVID